MILCREAFSSGFSNEHAETGTCSDAFKALYIRIASESCALAKENIWGVFFKFIFHSGIRVGIM